MHTVKFYPKACVTRLSLKNIFEEIVGELSYGRELQESWTMHFCIFN